MNIMNDYYYDIGKDIIKYPDAFVYLIIGGRNTGKTYGSLKYMLDNDCRFVFLKRTQEDVDLLCTSTKSNQYSIDLSPFKSINRDIGTNIRAVKIHKGLGAFYNCNENDEPSGTPLGYLLSLSAVSKFKGFDLSECSYLIFDEFIPQKWDRINRGEGNQLLDLYKTIARDREHRNQEQLRILCLANAVNISNPVMNTLEVTNIVANMNVNNIEEYYQENRGIYIRMLHTNEDFLEVEKNSMLYKAMGETEWGSMTFNNEFGYDDFTSVGNTSLKYFKNVVSFSYKKEKIYVYTRNGMYYFTKSKYSDIIDYNLNLENDQKKFFRDYVYNFQNKCINGKCLFQNYTMYDIVMNYKLLFKI